MSTRLCLSARVRSIIASCVPRNAWYPKILLRTSLADRGWVIQLELSEWLYRSDCIGVIVRTDSPAAALMNSSRSLRTHWRSWSTAYGSLDMLWFFVLSWVWAVMPSGHNFLVLTYSVALDRVPQDSCVETDSRQWRSGRNVLCPQGFWQRRCHSLLSLLRCETTLHSGFHHFSCRLNQHVVCQLHSFSIGMWHDRRPLREK